jgi:acyl-CoA thioesterase-1
MSRSFPLLCLLCAALALPLSARAEEAILVLGDSLSAAHGISPDQGWVHLLGERLKAEGLPQRLVNAAISGETTAGGLARLPALLARHRPTVLVVELGANDGMMGQPVAAIRANLRQIITAGREAGARILLVSMRLPPNFGPAYTDAFRDLYGAVAEEQGIALSRFLLDGVLEHGDWMQEDGIHPRAAAQATLLANVWPALARLLGATPAATSPAAASPTARPGLPGPIAGEGHAAPAPEAGNGVRAARSDP